MDLVRTVAPVETPVSLADVKAHCRVYHDDDDKLLTAYLAAATDLLDGHAGFLGRALCTQTWALRFDCGFPGWRIALPLLPLISIASITYVDSEGAAQTVPPSDYEVLLGGDAAVQPTFGKVWPVARPQAAGATISFVCGYGAASSVPATYKAAILLMTANLYGGDGAFDPAVERLLGAPARIF